MRRAHWAIWTCSLLLTSGAASAAEPAAAPSASPAEPSAAAAPFVGTITGSKVNIRAGANRNYEIVHQIAKGEQLVIVGQRGEWYAVELPPEAACFVAAKFVTLEGKNSGRVNSTTLNVRSGPSSKHNVLAKLAAGEPVTVLGEQQGWLRVVPPAAARGWIARSFVQPDAAGRVEVVRAAQQSRQSTVIASAAGTLPPTGGGPAPATGAPAAQGQLETARHMFWRRPAPYQLVRDRRLVAYVASQSIALGDYLHQDVSVWGTVADPSSKTPVITVTHLVAASPPPLPAATPTAASTTPSTPAAPATPHASDAAPPSSE